MRSRRYHSPQKRLSCGAPISRTFGARRIDTLLRCIVDLVSFLFIHTLAASRTDWPGMTRIAAEERPKTEAMRAELREIFATRGPKPF
jgi:hypothetical protein|eukprot:COSAG03_NODE_161_length_11325_cov_3.659362_3_plen_88_part_00